MNAPMIRLIVVLALAIGCHAAAAAPAAVVTGTATVKDGDGILFGAVEIRLQGIAAPEDNSCRVDPGGPEASAALRSIVNSHTTVRCELDGTLAAGRPAGICFVAGHDLGELQVRGGYARDCPHFSKGRYAGAERAARAAGRDLSKSYDLPLYCLGRSGPRPPCNRR